MMLWDEQDASLDHYAKEVETVVASAEVHMAELVKYSVVETMVLIHFQTLALHSLTEVDQCEVGQLKDLEAHPNSLEAVGEV